MKDLNVRLEKLIKALTIDLMDCGGTNPEATCDQVKQEHPKLYAAAGADRVLDLCRKIQLSSEPAKSAWLQKLFAKFNTKYFGGQLDNFAVLAVYHAGDGSIEVTSGRVDFRNRQIYIELTGIPGAMQSALLYHMALVSTNTVDDTEEGFLREMRRLRKAGAPVDFCGSVVNAGKND